MPTARPSMTPSMGVTDIMSITPENARVALVAMATPNSAVSTGSAAGTTARSMISSTRAAMITPTISAGPTREEMSCASSWENSASTPSTGWSLMASITALLVSDSTEVWSTEKLTTLIAELPSRETTR